MEKSKEIKLSLLTFFFLSFAIIISHFLLPWIYTYDFPTDGFSLPYQVAMMMGNFACTILGLWILRKILIQFFSEKVSAITILLIGLGTNYFHLAVCDGAMPQNYLFTLYALIIWFTIRWHDWPKKKYALFLGLFTGLAILVRPDSALILIVPLIWGIADKDSWRRKWILIRSNLSHVILCIIFMASVVFLQMIFWKVRSGSFFFNGFESGEKMKLIAPYLWQVLFSYKNGWLICTPMMIFSLAGFYFLAERKKSIFYSAFLFFLLNLLIVAGRPEWWYGDSFGQTALIESYIVLALPLGFFIQWLFTKKIFIQIPLFLIFIFFIILNLFQTWKYMNFINEPSYLKVLASYDFENRDFQNRLNLDSNFVKNGKFAFRMDSAMQFSPGISMTYGELSKIGKAHIRAVAWIYSKEPFNANPGSLVATSNHSGSNYKYESVGFDDERMRTGQWNKVILHYLTPDSPDPEDILQVYIWYRGNKELYIDDIKIELFEPKYYLR
jgi:hypothetical protein